MQLDTVFIWMPDKASSIVQDRAQDRDQRYNTSAEKNVIYERRHEKTTFWFPTWSDTNQAVQLNKQSSQNLLRCCWTGVRQSENFCQTEKKNVRQI